MVYFRYFRALLTLLCIFKDNLWHLFYMFWLHFYSQFAAFKLNILKYSVYLCNFLGNQEASPVESDVKSPDTMPANDDKTQKVILWWKKTKNSNCDKTKKKKVVTKLILWQNSNCDKTELVMNSKYDKTQILTKQKNQTVTKLKNSICGKTLKFKLWQNLNYDKSQFMTKKYF